ncbi:MAG: dTDP-4-dehydrorhamnose reductase [Methylophilaceae bacterium]|nr:dTDP-4-dehydrorhamnose reductase [Methylophilaceae bacterium]
MKILITGVKGQVGSALMRVLTGHMLIGLSRENFDLTKPDQIKTEIDKYGPDLIINSAAYTNVDLAEVEPELAFKVNRDAPKIIAEKALEHKIPLIHFSTDYVFDGLKLNSYNESDKTNPKNIYGKSKLAGENIIQETGVEHYIFRTSFVYSNHGHNFYFSIKNLIKERAEIKVVSDQYSVPTSNFFIANQIKKIIPNLNKNNTGLYHLVPNGFCTRYDFAVYISKKYDSKINLNNIFPIKTKNYLSAAKRPHNSCLDNKKIKKIFMLEFEDWRVELDNVISRCQSESLLSLKDYC